MASVVLFGAVGVATAQVAYVDNQTGSLIFVDEDGNSTDTGVGKSSVDYLGQVTDFDRDGTRDVAVVDPNGNIDFYEAVASASATSLVSTGATARSAPSSLAVADTDGNGEPEVLFANSDDNNNIYKVDPNGNTSEVVGVSAKGIIGFGNFDGADGDKEIVFVEPTNNEIRFADVGTSTSTGTGYSGVKENNFLGAGPLADFNGNGTPRAAVVDDAANDVFLVDSNGNTTNLDAQDGGNSFQAKVGPIGALRQGSGGNDLGVVFHDNSTGKPTVVNLSGALQEITGATQAVLRGVSGDRSAGELSSTRLTVEGTAGTGDATTNSTGDDHGWRMIGPPVSGALADDVVSLTDQVGSLIEFNLKSGDNMFYRWDDSSGNWAAVTDSTASSSLVNGRGRILFLFDDSGTNNADPLDPNITFDILTGSIPTSNVTVSGLDTGASFHLLANPYNQPFDLTGVEDTNGNSLGSGNTDFKTTVQAWSVSNTSYTSQTVNTAFESGSGSMFGSGDIASAWQGFFVERSASGQTDLTFNTTGKTTGDRGILKSTPSRSRVHLGLELTVDRAGTRIARDEASSLYFHPEATTGEDAFDASKLTPLTYPYAVIGPVGPHAEGDTAIKAQESRPLDQELPLEVPLRLQIGGEIDGTATIQGRRWQGVPSDWTVTLIDTKGTADPDDDVEHELTGSGPGYEFIIGEGASKNARTSAPEPSGRRIGTDGYVPDQLSLSEAAMQRKSQSDSTRFKVRVNGSPLPVELVAFDAILTDGVAHLQWRTASETNNAGFEVQHRSPSGDRFEPLGFVESKVPGGTTTTSRQYRYETEALPAGKHAFRLRQVDTDGSATLSDTIAVQVQLGSAAQVEVVPNPVRTQATLTLQVRSQQDVTARLYDTLGRRVRTLHEGPLAPQRRHAFSVQAEELSSGLYLLQVEGEQFRETRRVTVVR